MQLAETAGGGTAAENACSERCITADVLLNGRRVQKIKNGLAERPWKGHS